LNGTNKIPTASRNSTWSPSQVEKVSPDRVARDEQGKPYTVRYEAVNAMLLNEFLKEHRKGIPVALTANGGQAQRSNPRFLGLTFFHVIDTLRIASSPLGDSSQAT